MTKSFLIAVTLLGFVGFLLSPHVSEAATSGGSPPPTVQTVTGRLVEGSTPLAGVDVAVADNANQDFWGTAKHTTTDSNGVFVFSMSELGNRMVNIETTSGSYWSYVATYNQSGQVNLGNIPLSRK